MRFRTHNNLYTLTDAGDGAFYLQGHQKYCPVPTLVTLGGPVEIGRCVVFQPASPSSRGPVMTTPVVEILD